MAVYRRGKKWWATFYVGERRYRKPTGAVTKRAATKVEHDLIEAAKQGSLSVKQEKPKRLDAAVTAYLEDKKIRCAARTVELESERLNIVKKHFGDVRLTAITADAIAKYQQKRHSAHIANRTINMDVGALSRVLQFCGLWQPLRQHVKKLPDADSLTGRALTVQEQDRLLAAAQSNPEWDHVYCAAIVAAHTSMCSVEVRRLRRRDVDLFNQTVSVPYGKNKHRLRTLPLMPEAVKALARMVDRLDRLGFTSPDHYLWCACKWNRFDATKPQSRWDTAWHALRDKAELGGLRFHDLRYTIITELAETSTPDMVIQSIAGHVTKKMLDHYSQIRLAAKRKALETVVEFREQKRREQKAETDTDPVQ